MNKKLKEYNFCNIIKCLYCELDVSLLNKRKSKYLSIVVHIKYTHLEYFYLLYYLHSVVLGCWHPGQILLCLCNDK